jgi:hypothetical protein
VPFSSAESSIVELVVIMANKYRIRPGGPHFEIIDRDGERVCACRTEEEAKLEIAVCLNDDVMWESARQLIEISVDTFMKTRNVDSRTAHYWIREAAD